MGLARSWWGLVLLLLTLGAALSVVVSITLGPTPISVPQVFGVLGSRVLGQPNTGDRLSETIVLQIRLPRILMALLVGAALSISGSAMQGLFRNPLADPYTLGISSGAFLGMAVVLAYDFYPIGSATVPLLGFLSATATALVVYSIARVGGRVPLETVILAGVAVGFLLGSVASFILYTSVIQRPQILFRLLGSLSGAGWEQLEVAFLPIALGGIVLFLLARGLDAMAQGEEAALHLGVPVEAFKAGALAAASLVTATAVGFSGIIGFVGLIIPHTTRLLVGPNQRLLLPASALAGGIFLLWADNLARVAIAPAEMPLGIVTALSGSPFFLYLLRRSKRRGIMP